MCQSSSVTLDKSILGYKQVMILVTRLEKKNLAKIKDQSSALLPYLSKTEHCINLSCWIIDILGQDITPIVAQIANLQSSGQLQQMVQGEKGVLRSDILDRQQVRVMYSKNNQSTATTTPGTSGAPGQQSFGTTNQPFFQVPDFRFYVQN